MVTMSPAFKGRLRNEALAGSARSGSQFRNPNFAANPQRVSLALAVTFWGISRSVLRQFGQGLAHGIFHGSGVIGIQRLLRDPVKNRTRFCAGRRVVGRRRQFGSTPLAGTIVKKGFYQRGTNGRAELAVRKPVLEP